MSSARRSIVVCSFSLPLMLAGARSGPGQEVPFLRGDTNVNGDIDLSDPLTNLFWLYTGGSAPTCMDAADADDSGRVDLTDVIFELQWLYVGGPQSPEPGPEACGPDPTDDFLDCASYSACVVQDTDFDGMDDNWEQSHFGGLMLETPRNGASRNFTFGSSRFRCAQGRRAWQFISRRPPGDLAGFRSGTRRPEAWFPTR